MIMKKGYIYLSVLLCLFYIVQNVGAEEKKKLNGFVANPVTKEFLLDAKIELLSSDSTVIDTASANGYFEGKQTALFSFHLDKNRQLGDYIIRCSYKGYETTCTNIHVKFYKREKYINLGTFYLKKIPRKIARQLDEVTVTASKIKFYLNGDTVVYNADAFQLSEGSMLDALISQLPGAELKDDGRIYVNGEFVNSLLLNGKDFFKGNNKIMLDNLPSYMVKDIKVYKKEDDLTKAIGHNTDGKKNLVMDIVLKREYSIGWIGNIEAGTGSNNRYLNRLFASRFTPHSRISVFGNINNLNENRTPRKTGDWTPASMSDGLLATKMGGIDYTTEAADKHYSFSGNAQITHSDTDNKTTSTSTTFLTGGDTYGRSQDISSSCNTSFTTDHEILLQKTFAYYLALYPHLDYQKYTNRSSSLSGTFSEDPSKQISSGLLDSINAPNAGTLLRQIAINRNIKNNQENGHSLNTSMSLLSFINIKHCSDIVRFLAYGSYHNAEEEAFQHYRVDYPSDASSSTDYRNQYYRTPDRNYAYNVVIEYWHWLSDYLCISPFYKYEQIYQSDERSLYRLDQLSGWDENTTEYLGALPSTTDSLQLAFDGENSYYSRRHDFAHETGFDLRYKLERGDKEVYINCYFPIRFEKDALSYQRAALDTAFCRHIIFFDPNIDIDRYDYSNNKNNHFNFHYECNSSTPSMTYLLSIRDDSNPLYVTLGNSKLKNTHTHNFSMHYNTQLKEQKSMYWNLGYSITQNALAMGYVYNKSTGVRTTTPDNVNGNWNGYGELNFFIPLDKAKHLTFSTYSRASFYKSVDLVSVSGASASSRSTVGSLYLTESIKTDYQINSKAKIGAKIKGVWTNATSTREDFTTINSVDFNYGLTGQVELPWKMQFSTDLTEYSRRGYENHSMNTNELVWNARLAKRIGGNISIILDGFDILGNLSNVRRTLNAQGRTESYYNVIPSYVMLHAIYRLNIQPKKKG